MLTVFIAVTFVCSAIGKLASSEALVPYLSAMGLSRRLAKLIRPAVSFLELAVSLLMLTGIAWQWSVTAAAGITITFVITHVASIMRRSQEPCRCFGAVDAELRPAVGLVRAVLLAAAAIAVAAQSWTSGYSLPRYDLYIVLSGTLAALTYVVLFPIANGVPTVLKLAHELREGLVVLRKELDSRSRMAG
ncbi:MAG: MauE/DoxX family redox-associated membrane protein [Micromonosporaceae bacterium]